MESNKEKKYVIAYIDNCDTVEFVDHCKETDRPITYDYNTNMVHLDHGDDVEEKCDSPRQTFAAVYATDCGVDHVWEMFQENVNAGHSEHDKYYCTLEMLKEEYFIVEVTE